MRFPGLRIRKASAYLRSAGDILLPQRDSLATIRRIRDTIGEYNFCSQYQQDPTPAGGVMVKESWLRYYQPGEEPAQFDRIVQSWDTANKASELSDYSVCTTWGVRDKSFYLLDVFRERLNYPDLKRKVFELVGRYSATTILIEDKASGTQLIQDLISEQMYGVQPHQPPSGTDKIMRLHTQTTMFANGHVLLPTIAPWLADYEKEILSFPGSRNDDQVDSPTQALAYMKRDRCPRHLEETRREPQLASFDAHTSPVTTVFRPLVPLALVGSRKTSVARVHQRQ